MKLIRRDCPVKITLTPCRPYCLEVYLEIGDDRHVFRPGVTSYFFSELMSAIYALYFEGYDCHRNPCVHSCSGCTEKTFSSDNPVSSDNETRIYTDVSWDENEAQCQITICRVASDWPGVPPKKSADPVSIIVSYKGNGGKCDEFTYTVDGRDLCYAVGKAATDAIKKYGFHGYSFSTSDGSNEGDYINANQLVFFKAYALKEMDARTLREEGWGFSSPFAEELELLLFDM